MSERPKTYMTHSEAIQAEAPERIWLRENYLEAHLQNRTDLIRRIRKRVERSLELNRNAGGKTETGLKIALMIFNQEIGKGDDNIREGSTN